MQKFKFLIVLILIFFNHGLVWASEINPFIPKIKEPSFIDNGNKYVEPLKKWDVFQYDLIGVVLSPQRNLALIETPDGEIYTLTIGDKIGNKEDEILEVLIDRLVLSSQLKSELILKNHKL